MTQTAKQGIAAALTAVKGEFEKIKTQRLETQTQIQNVKDEISRLQAMPVRRADFSLLLKEHIAAQAAESEKRLLSALNETGKEYNKRGLKDLQPRMIGLETHGNLRPLWLFSGFETSFDFLSIDQLSDGKNTLPLLCYLLPDVIHDRIMHTIDTKIGKNWGNDDTMPIKERREKIIDLEEELQNLNSRLQEMETAIEEFGHLKA